MNISSNSTFGNSTLNATMIPAAEETKGSLADVLGETTAVVAIVVVSLALIFFGHRKYKSVREARKRYAVAREREFMSRDLVALAKQEKERKKAEMLNYRNPLYNTTNSNYDYYSSSSSSLHNPGNQMNASFHSAASREFNGSSAGQSGFFANSSATLGTIPGGGVSTFSLGSSASSISGSASAYFDAAGGDTSASVSMRSVSSSPWQGDALEPIMSKAERSRIRWHLSSLIEPTIEAAAAASEKTLQELVASAAVAAAASKSGSGGNGGSKSASSRNISNRNFTPRKSSEGDDDDQDRNGSSSPTASSSSSSSSSRTSSKRSINSSKRNNDNTSPTSVEDIETEKRQNHRDNTTGEPRDEEAEEVRDKDIGSSTTNTTNNAKSSKSLSKSAVSTVRIDTSPSASAAVRGDPSGSNSSSSSLGTKKGILKRSSQSTNYTYEDEQNLQKAASIHSIRD